MLTIILASGCPMHCLSPEQTVMCRRNSTVGSYAWMWCCRDKNPRRYQTTRGALCGLRMQHLGPKLKGMKRLAAATPFFSSPSEPLTNSAPASSHLSCIPVSTRPSVPSVGFADIKLPFHPVAGATGGWGRRGNGEAVSEI